MQNDIESSESNSIIKSFKKINEILDKNQKKTLYLIALFALVISIAELSTASVIFLFSQVLIEPKKFDEYLSFTELNLNLNDSEKILYFGILLGSVYLLKNLLIIFESLFQNFSIHKMSFDFKSKLLKKYSQTDYEFYLNRNSSYGMYVVGSDAEQTFAIGLISLASIFSEVVIFLTLISFIIYVNPVLSLLILIFVVLILILSTKFFFPFFYKLGKEFQETGIKTSKSLMQFFQSFREMILLNKWSNFIDEYNISSKKRAKIQAIQNSFLSINRNLIEIIFIIIFISIIFYFNKKESDPLQIITILSIYIYSGFRLIPGLNRIINLLNNFKSCLPSINRVHHEYLFLKTNNFLNYNKFSFTKSINISNVSLVFSSLKKTTLKNINFEIKKGESIGIIGQTGAGKTSLINLILGLLNPTKGSVLIDKKYRANSFQWQKKIGYVPQNVYLIDDSIINNIVFGEKIINQTQLKRCLKESQLDNLIKKLPRKINTIVGERGVRISGGELQRMGIARALYRNPEVLVFDEATSSLDIKTEEKIMKTIYKLQKDRTIIIIAHRLSTLKKCDKVYEIKNGQLKQVKKL